MWTSVCSTTWSTRVFARWTCWGLEVVSCIYWLRIICSLGWVAGRVWDCWCHRDGFRGWGGHFLTDHRENSAASDLSMSTWCILVSMASSTDLSQQFASSNGCQSHSSRIRWVKRKWCLDRSICRLLLCQEIGLWFWSLGHDGLHGLFLVRAVFLQISIFPYLTRVSPQGHDKSCGPSWSSLGCYWWSKICLIGLLPRNAHTTQV